MIILNMWTTNNCSQNSDRLAGSNPDDHCFNCIGESSRTQFDRVHSQLDHTSPRLLIFSQHPWLRIRVVLTDLPAVTACFRVEHTDVLNLLDEIEQYIRPDDVLPDGFLFVDAGCLACLDQFSRSCSACPRAERVQEDVWVLVNQPTNQVREVNRRAFFPQRAEQQSEFGVSLVAVPEQNGERMVFRDDRRSPDITLDRIELLECRNPVPAKHRLEVLEKIFDGYDDPEATIDAGVLVEMFLNSDGTVDTEALMGFEAEGEDSASTESKEEETEVAKEESGESSPENQATFDQFSDGFTSAFHPVLVSVFAGLTTSGLMARRLRREVEALTSSPGTALRPSRGRVAKAATAYMLFVGLIAFNLVNLGLIPSGVL